MTNINIILFLASGQCKFYFFGQNNAHISLTNTVSSYLCLSHSLAKAECLSVCLSLVVSHITAFLTHSSQTEERL